MTTRTLTRAAGATTVALLLARLTTSPVTDVATGHQGWALGVLPWSRSAGLDAAGRLPALHVLWGDEHGVPAQHLLELLLSMGLAVALLATLLAAAVGALPRRRRTLLVPATLASATVFAAALARTYLTRCSFDYERGLFYVELAWFPLVNFAALEPGGPPPAAWRISRWLMEAADRTATLAPAAAALLLWTLLLWTCVRVPPDPVRSRRQARR